jgi:drug/metabolite transporter (DMT)-like permease
VTTRQMGSTEWAMMIALTALWSLTFFVVEIGLREIGPFWLVTGRVALGAATLWVLVLALGVRGPESLTDWRDLLVMGLLNNAIPFTCIFWAQVHLTAGMASILNATTPIFTVVIAHVLLADERATPLKTIGVLFGIAGVIVLIGPEALQGISGSLWGQIAVVCAAISYGFAGVWGRRLARLPSMTNAAGMLTMSTMLMIPVSVYAEGAPDFDLSWPTWASIAILGIAGSGMAYVLFFRILERAGATNLMLVTLMIPPGTILLGAVFLDEQLTQSAIAGMLLIFAGLAFVDGRIFRRRKPA